MKILLFVILALIVFGPELMPRCDCCGRLKPRFRFRYHVCVSGRLSRKGNLSLCRHCCEAEDIQSLSAYRKRKEIEDRWKYKVRWQL